MDLSPTQDQRLIDESATRFIAKRYTADVRRAALQSPQGFNRDIWNEFADLGWLGLSIPEAYGGFDADAATVGILMEALGRGLVVEPYLQSAVVSAKLIVALGSPTQQAQLLPPIADGSAIFTFAHMAPHSGFDVAKVDVIAKPTTRGWRLDGRKQFVVGMPGADTLLVSARLDDGSRENGGIGVFVVSAKAAGIGVSAFPMVDGCRAAHLAFNEVSAIDLLGDRRDALEAIDAVLDEAIIAMAAEAVGCMQVLLDETIAYTKTRQQFGKPLASHQVLQHRMAAMSVVVEEARASAQRAQLTPVGDTLARRRAASSAKVKVGRSARFIAEEAVQLHGAMGVTEELSVGAYFKRLLAFEVSYGSPDHHLARHAQTYRPAVEKA